MARKRKAGYLYPTPIEPYPTRCITLHIPDEPKYRQAFWGQLFQLTKAWTWEQDSAVPAGELLAVSDYWFSLIWPRYLAYLAGEDECGDMANCCPEPIIRFTESGLTEVSNDNGETWQANEGDPRFLPIPFLPRPEPPGEARRCNAANSVRQLLEEATDQIIANAGAWASLQALIDTILAILAAVFPGLGTIAALIIAGVVTALFFLGNAAFDAAMTEAVYDLFQCLLYCHMDEEGHIDTAGWQALKLDIYQQVGGIAGNWLWGWVSSLGVSGINASTGMFTGVTADCSDCECSEGCNLDNWNIVVDPTNASGEIVSKDPETGYIVCRSTNAAPNGGYYITLQTDDPINSCCFTVSVTQTGGFVHTWAVWFCGTAIDYGNLQIVPVPNNECLALIQPQAASPFEMTIQFADCP